MDWVEPGSGEGGFSSKSIAVACIMISRFLQTQHPEFGRYLKTAISSAAAAGLSDADLHFARLVVRSIGG